MPIEHRPEEMAELNQRAVWALEHASQLAPALSNSHNRPSMRVWHYPAFANHVSWTLFDSSGQQAERQCLVRQAVWDRTHDLARFANPLEGIRQGFRAPPTISITDVLVPQDVVEQFVGSVARLPILVLGIEVPLGLDGEVSGVETYDPFLRVWLEWWGDGPAEWRPFTAAISGFRQTLSSFVEGNRP